MRTSGLVDAPCRLGPGDHVCWVYDDAERYGRDVVAFLAEGLARGEQVGYVAGGTMDDALRALRPLGDVGELVRRRTLSVSLAADAYPGPDAAPQEQVRRYAALTDAALAGGYRGLRVAADVTLLVLGADERAAFADYEHLVDRFMDDHPFTALCSYDGSLLGEAVAELAHLHPATNLRSLPFHLAARADGALRLAGEVDALSSDALGVALRHAGAAAGPVLRIDGSGLRFIDHRGLLALDAAAPAVELVTSFTGAATVSRLLGLEHLQVRIEA